MKARSAGLLGALAGLAFAVSACSNVLGIEDIEKPSGEDGGDSSVAQGPEAGPGSGTDAGDAATADHASPPPIAEAGGDAEAGADAEAGPEGDACAASTSCTPSGNTCQSGKTACDGTCGSLANVPNGTSCAGGVCENGACQPCVAGDSCEPTAAPCHVGKLTCGDAGAVCVDQGTNVAPGTACGAAGANTFCDPSGSCDCAGNQTCTFTGNVCHKGITSCTTAGNLGVSVCTDSGNDVSNGTSCGSGMECDNGTCTAVTCSTTTGDGGTATCVPSSACDLGVVSCPSGAFGAPSCTASGSAPSGTVCDGGVCNGSGACTACVAGNACTPSNPCDKGSQVCEPAISCTDTGTHQPAGTNCGGNNFCNGSGSCNCVAGGACTPTNPCHNGVYSCSTGVQVCVDQETDVTGNPSCGSGKFCNAGTCEAPTCVATQADGGAVSCTPTNRCHNGAVACTGPFGTQSCSDLGTDLANCTSCGSGSACSGGTCSPFTSGASCAFTNACEKGALSCTAESGIACVASGNEPAGTTCSNGSDNACDGNGNCDCSAGGACNLSGSCKAGVYSCSTGTQVCVAGATDVSNGTSCGTNMVCDNGTCAACTEGAVCYASTNACLMGTTDCSTGVPVCTNATTPASPGTTCSSGSDNACNGSGVCNCAQGGACSPSPDPCANGVYSCATGTATCVAGSAIASMNGKACGASSTGTCTGGVCTCPSGQEFYEGDCNTCPSFPMTSSTVYTTSGVTTASVSTIYVDAAKGTDDVCCGRSQTFGFGGPCQTIGHAASQAGGTYWTIDFTGDANGNAADKAYPIALSQGVQVSGQTAATSCVPGVSGTAVFSVDTDADLVGFSNLTIGATCQGAVPGASYGVYVANGGAADFGVPAGAVSISNVDQGIYVGPNGVVEGSSVTVRNTRIGVNFDGGQIAGPPFGQLTVTVDTATQDGIHCQSVTDTGLTSGAPGNYSIYATVQSAARYAIYAGPGCALGSSNAVSYVALGATSCVTPRPDNIGIYAEGNGSVTNIYGTISCMNSDAIVLANNTSLTGSPSVTIGGLEEALTIRNNGCAGVRAEAGTLTMAGATITANHWGVIQQTGTAPTVVNGTPQGIVNMDGYSGGTTSFPNTIYCNGKGEPGACCTSGDCPNGANIWNDSPQPILATNNYFGDSPVAKCTCNNALASCSCSGSAFGDTTPPDDLDVLVSPYTSGGATGAVTTTGNLILSSPTCSY